LQYYFLLILGLLV